MIEADDTALMAELTEDEGCSPRLYVDTRGNYSIGVGHNLEAAGLCQAAIDAQLVHDICIATNALNADAPWWRTLPDPQQRVMVNLCFNMGWATLSTFRNFLAAMQAGHWEAAAAELQNSRWWDQVGQRGPRMVRRLLGADG